MPTEGRDRQHTVLNPRTHVIYHDDNCEHIWNTSGQLDLYPNRWLRLSFAARKKGIVFNNLLTHFTVDSLREAFKAQDASKALGTDGIHKKVYGMNLEQNLLELVSKIHKGSYKPQIKRQFDIPKASGKTRPIAISCFEDKLVEWVLGKILESVYENFL
jgi:hypothetical protein